MSRPLFLALAALALAAHSRAEVFAVGESNPGFSTGARFGSEQVLGYGARAAALGSAFAGVAGGTDSLDWNPAGILGVPGPVLALHHHSWIGGINREAAVLAVPAGRWGAFATSFEGVFYGSVENRNEEGNLTGTFHPFRDTLKVAWAFPLLQTFTAGVVLENQQLNLSGDDFARMSAGVGLLWRSPDGVHLGASLEGAGTYVGTSPSSQEWRVGASGPLEPWKNHPSLWLLGATLEPFGVQRLQAGWEQEVAKRLQLRTGFQAALQNNHLQGFQGFTAGFGWALGDWTLDYAFLPVGELGNSHRVSLTTVLGRSSVPPPTATPTPTPTMSPTTIPTSTPAASPTPWAPPAATPSPTKPPGGTPTPGRALKLYFELSEGTPTPGPAAP